MLGVSSELESLQEKVVGFHYLGPNAGEVTQGYGGMIKLGATKADFDNLIGIHPTTAEVGGCSPSGLFLLSALSDLHHHGDHKV